MSRSTISTYAVFQMFPDEPTARTYLEGRLWPNGPICPECGNSDRITTRKAGFYRCNACKDFDFTVRTGTIFGRSHIPLHKWIYAMYLLVTARKGISSMQLAKEIGVTQKTAWFMLSRLREACGSDDDIAKMSGTVEVDECFIGGTEANKHARKKLNLGRGPVGKTAVLGLRERRGGRVVAKVIADRTIQTIQGVIFDTVHTGSTVYSDDHIAYSGMDGLFYRHDTVNHSIGEYARPEWAEVQEDPDNLVEMPNRAECKHEWKEEYYGWQCVRCKLFYAFGCAPFEFSEDDDFDTFDGEREDCEEEE